MPQYYVNTSVLQPQPAGVQHITYAITGRAAQSAPGVPSSSNPTTQTAQLAEPVNLDALIAKRRLKARRMRQR